MDLLDIFFVSNNLLPNFRGMYVCRTLSYKGAEFEVIEAPLEAEMEVCKFIFICFLMKLFIEFLPSPSKNIMQKLVNLTYMTIVYSRS